MGCVCVCAFNSNVLLAEMGGGGEGAASPNNDKQQSEVR